MSRSVKHILVFERSRLMIQLIINGILLGSVYALLGLGMTMIFGIVRLTNLAHGEFVVLGAYASTILSQLLKVNPLFTLLITVPFLFGAGALLQYVLINRAMDRGAETALLVTFGISILLQDGMHLLFSADAQHISTSFEVETLHIWNLDIPVLNIVLFAISLSCVLILTVFLNHTYTGRAIRAVSDDREAAMLSGVPVRRVYAIAMGISMALAGVAGLCVGMKWTFYPSSGGQYLLISFIVVVLGGMNSTFRTLLAGLVIGIIQVVGGANYGLIASYAVLLVLLSLNPVRGFFRKSRKK